MKKIALLSILALGLWSFNADSSTIKKPEKQQTTSATCKFGQCKGTAKSTGKRCKHCVSKSGDKYCYQHK